MLDTNKRSNIQPSMNYLAKVLIKFNISPNQLTIIALILGVIASVLFYFDFLILSICLLWLSGLFDVLDGSVARLTNTSSFGTIMDIVFDRIVELSIIIVAAIKYPDYQLLFLLLVSSIVLSMTIFLSVGAISEKQSEKSFYYQPGLVERTEGFIFLTLMIAFPLYINYFTVIFTLGIIFTALQRFLEAKKILSN